jgi:hypothetical protein
MHRRLVATYIYTLCLLLLAGPAVAQPEAPTSRPYTQPEASPSKPYKPPRLGPISIQSKDGNTRLSLGFAGQLRFSVKSKDPGGGGERDTAAEVVARRLRPTFRGTVLSPNLGYYFHLSTTPGSLEFMDLYMDYKLTDSFRFRLGQWKVPFTRYRIRSFKALTLADWAVTAKYFGAERQIGLAMHNGYEKHGASFEYEVGLFTGVNARKSHATGLASIFGEKLSNPSDLFDPAAPADLHPELVAHVAYNCGGINTATDTDWAGSGFRYSVGLSMAWDLNADMYQDLTLRLAPEVLIKWRGLSAFAVFYMGFTRLSEDSVLDQRLDLLGGLVQASYLFFRRVEIAARYAVVHTDDSLLTSARARAQSLVAGEADADKKKALAAQYKNAGKLETQQDVTFGVNVYIRGNSLKWQNDLTVSMLDRVDGKRTNVTYRSQIQLTF